MAYKGIGYLRRKLAQKRERVQLRYRYYEMKNYVLDFGISTPPDLRHWNSVVGWCAKAVDSLADRLLFNGESVREVAELRLRSRGGNIYVDVRREG